MARRAGLLMVVSWEVLRLGAKIQVVERYEFAMF